MYILISIAIFLPDNSAIDIIFIASADVLSLKNLFKCLIPILLCLIVCLMYFNKGCNTQFYFESIRYCGSVIEMIYNSLYNIKMFVYCIIIKYMFYKSFERIMLLITGILKIGILYANANANASLCVCTSVPCPTNGYNYLTTGGGAIGKYYYTTHNGYPVVTSASITITSSNLDTWTARLRRWSYSSQPIRRTR